MPVECNTGKSEQLPGQACPTSQVRTQLSQVGKVGQQASSMHRESRNLTIKPYEKQVQAPLACGSPLNDGLVRNQKGRRHSCRTHPNLSLEVIPDSDPESGANAVADTIVRVGMPIGSKFQAHSSFS